MHLYILTSTVNIDVSEITLENGCLPVISGHRGLEDATRGVYIEPAIWFKVLVIDAISIDCAQRRISWSSVSGVAVDFKGNDSGIEAGGSYCSSDENNPTGDAGRLTRSITESAFDCGECYSYDRDLDEVFDSVPDLVSEYQQNVITREQFHERLMHLLHISVLPIIKLGCEDITNVSECLKQQDVYLHDVDRKILALTENLEKRRKDKKEQRRKFIDEILKLSPKSPAYTKDLVQALANDIVLDVSEAYDAFDKAQRDVDQSKKLPANACDQNLLQTQRKHRDQVHSNYENILTVRERLREMKESKGTSLAKKFTKPFRSISADHQENPLGAVYLVLTKGEQDKVLEIRNFTDQKLLMLSVKEAMRTTLDELLTGEETFGVDADSTGSLKATNVLNSLAASTSWQTLAEQVALVLSNREHPLAKAHIKFCADVNSRCQRAVEELTIYRRTSSQSTLCIRSSGNSGSSDKSVSDSSLENSFSKESGSIAESLRSPGSDTTSIDRSRLDMRTSRDSAVSENSCASARSSNFSGGYESYQLNEAAGSRRSECSVISEVSVVDERDHRKRRVKKDKTKKPAAAATFHSYLGDEQCINSPVYFERSSDDSVMILKDDRSVLRREIDGLLQLIGEHFNDMCERLQKELKLTRQRYYRKIWLNYESHFYQETMDSLVQLYQLDYTNVTEALCDSLKTLTVSDLSLDDALLSHMLQDVSGTQGTPSAEEPGTPSAVRSGNAEQAGCAAEGDFMKLLRKKRDSCSSVDQLASPPKDPSRRYCSLVTEETNDHDSVNPQQAPASDRTHLTTDLTPDPSVCLLRRRLSELPSRPKTVRLSLNVQYPKSGVIVYERLLCPVRNTMLVEGVTAGTVASPPSPGLPPPFDSVRSGSSSSDHLEEDQGLCKVKTTTMKPKYRRQFAAALRCVNIVVATRCPSAKFQHLTRCLREVSHQITNFYQELYGRSMGACSDELMDALVILLCNLDGAVLSQLYCQIMILADIIPPFFNGSPFSFTLVQFVGACQFVQERILLKKNRISS